MRTGDKQLQGVDILRFTDDDTIAERTVMVRSISGVRALADGMQQLLTR